jgi:hypothetical protein
MSGRIMGKMEMNSMEIKVSLGVIEEKEMDVKK